MTECNLKSIKSMDEIIYTIALNKLNGIPLIVKRLLLEKCGTAETVFKEANRSSYINDNFGSFAHNTISSPIKHEAIEKEVRLAASKGIELIAYSSPKYPRLLKNIYDPPLLLYKKGLDIPQDKLFVAVVGARRATRYGSGCAYSIAKDLARAGVVVVSGMASGIDSRAHHGAIDGGGHTVAVLGSGLCVPYPKSNIGLFRKICEVGTVISEFDLFTAPYPYNFPQRNRVVSGLSHGTFVAEASLKSGARITARLALEQNREVFSLPGRVDSDESLGCNELIKWGHAKLVTGVPDILEEFQQLKDKLSFDIDYNEKVSDEDMNAEEKDFLACLKKGEPVEIDGLSDLTNLNNQEVLDMILRLELKGALIRVPGNQILRGR